MERMVENTQELQGLYIWIANVGCKTSRMSLGRKWPTLFKECKTFKGLEVWLLMLRVIKLQSA
jgi:hypothetical protein